MNSFLARPIHGWMIGITLLISLTMLVLPHPLLFVILALVPIGLFVVVRLSVVMVLLFIIFSFFRLHEAFPFLMPLKLPLLLALASLFVFGLRLFINRDLKIDWPREFTLLSLFLMVIILGIFFAANKPEAVKYFKEIYIKIYLMTLIGYWMLKDPKEFKTLLIMILVAGTIIALKAISNKVFGIGLIEGTRVTIGRAMGSALGDPNDLSLVLLFPLAYAISTFFTTHKKMLRFVVAIATLLLIVAIIMTQSRGGVLGITSIIGYFSYRQIKSKVAFLSISAIALIALLAVAGVSDRQTTQANDGELDASAMGRLYAWQTAWSMALNNPVVGVGMENYYYNYYFYTSHWDGKNHVVHSTWFNVMSETGFLGFGLFMGMIILLFRKTLILTRNASVDMPVAIQSMCHASTPALLGFAVSGTFLTQSFTWPLYLQMVIILALYRYQKQFASESDKDTLQNAKPK